MNKNKSKDAADAGSCLKNVKKKTTRSNSRMIERQVEDEYFYVPEKKDLFKHLIQALHSVVDFEDAFILEMQDDQRMLSIVATSDNLLSTWWEPDTVFKRVLSGQPVASHDIRQVNEWAWQSENVRGMIRSAIHVNLQGERLGILVITNSKSGYFQQLHIDRLNKFVPLASQALLSLDLKKAVIQRDRFFQLSMDLMGIVDYEGNFRQLNDSWKLILGHRAEDFYRNRLFSFLHKDDVQLFVDAINRLAKTGDQCLVEGRFRKVQGSYCWLSCSLAAYPDEKLCYIVARDVTDRVLVEQQLAYDARHDSLTGLYNRAEFMERLDIAFTRSLRERQYAFALFYMDLNGFKAVNDTLGHDIGDALLKKVSRCLIDVVREIDTVSRFGGDEFTILLDGIRSHEQLEMVVDRIHEKFRRPFFFQGHEVATSMSIGIALSSKTYKNAEHMLCDADSAMYKAKTEKNQRYILIEKKHLKDRAVKK